MSEFDIAAFAGGYTSASSKPAVKITPGQESLPVDLWQKAYEDYQKRMQNYENEYINRTLAAKQNTNNPKRTPKGRQRNHHLRSGRTSNPAPNPKKTNTNVTGHKKTRTTPLTAEEIAKKKTELLERLKTRNPQQYAEFLKNHPNLTKQSLNSSKFAKVKNLFKGRNGWIAAAIALALGTTATICAYNSGKNKGSAQSADMSETGNSASTSSNAGMTYNDWEVIRRVMAYNA